MTATMTRAAMLPDMCASCKQDHHNICLADGERTPCGCGCYLSTIKYLKPVENKVAE